MKYVIAQYLIGTVVMRVMVVQGCRTGLGCPNTSQDISLHSHTTPMLRTDCDQTSKTKEFMNSYFDKDKGTRCFICSEWGYKKDKYPAKVFLCRADLSMNKLCHGSYYWH